MCRRAGWILKKLLLGKIKLLALALDIKVLKIFFRIEEIHNNNMLAAKLIKTGPVY